MHSADLYQKYCLLLVIIFFQFYPNMSSNNLVSDWMPVDISLTGILKNMKHFRI